ncbi:exodeoxyribonuclease VII small subunit [Labrys sp. LIt4]|uniref:Exodeoxyribonuclease 7 small subunit n=1 Tax=Labrys okinawensis TaxID=346911 RepID=A0A2S9QDH0_9HYPH|nr:MULTISPECIES: exodeoxyribonuclease VII small subunit [Labrys]MBP0580162.1 exodeoxyribonuclease VII small subunit [Labrys sp. LIt4]PRH87398.1 exodeoxyribonuclease VII small subunit [Labrys okinawensis]
MADKPSDIATLSFEKALAELEQIVRSLEGGNVPLEESITLFGRGELLKAHCDKLLKVAEAKVDKIRLDAEGKPAGLEPLPEA